MNRRSIWMIIGIAATVALALVVVKVYKRHMDIWLADYIAGERAALPSDGVVDIMFLVADHYEPGGIEETHNFFVKGFRELAARHKDSDGIPPKHSWFYPLEQFRGFEVDSLVNLCRDGLGDVEVHLHHFDDTEASLRKQYVDGLDSLRAHQALICSTSAPYFGFVHGNWALDNSVKLDDGRSACGVNNEISMLQELGCYGDFTFPALFTTAQPSWTRGIGFVVDDPLEAKSHENHAPAKVGRETREEELMIMQGPMFINWLDWRFVTHPTIDDGQITEEMEPSIERVDHWLEHSSYVQGAESWRFIKLYTHCGDPGDARAFVGAAMDSTLTYLEKTFADGERFRLHYVTAREAYNIARAAELGMQGNPNDYRDYILPPYVYTTVESKRG